ncbi:MAG: MarR family transcriptional regulator [Burkholderia sp.]
MTGLPSLPTTLDEQLCFALYSTSLAMTKAYKPLLGRLSLACPQYLTMLVLWETDDIAVKGIAARLNLDSATVTPPLKRLESLGYLERVRGTRRRARGCHTRLTAEGIALRKATRSVPADLYCAMQQTPEFLGQLRENLRQLREFLKEHNEE